MNPTIGWSRAQGTPPAFRFTLGSIMKSLIFVSALLASCVSAAPKQKLAISDRHVFPGANTWGAPCLVTANDGTFWSFATNMYGCNVPIAKSKDFTTWDFVRANGRKKDAMPVLPTWVNQKKPALWAPDVSKLNSTHWIMYFSALDGASKRYKHCIGAAYATNIAGPYHSQKRNGKDVPWFCPPNGDQSIDPDQFVDTDGKRYVIYKHNMHNETAHPAQYTRFVKYATMDRAKQLTPPSSGCGNQGPPYRPTPIKIQEVSTKDGVSKVGGWTIIMDNRGHADMGNSESPTMMRDPASGNYFLFFSTGCYMDGTYATHYAVSHEGPKGPFLRLPSMLLGHNTPPGYDLTGVGTLDVLNDGSYGVMFSHDPKAMGQRPMRTMRFHTKGIHVRPDVTR